MKGAFDNLHTVNMHTPIENLGEKKKQKDVGDHAQSAVSSGH